MTLACLRGYEEEFKWVKNINIKSHRCKIAEKLLRAGSDLKIYLKNGDSNPLHWACYHSDYALSKVIFIFI